MADNVAVTEGSGKTIATTDVSGEQVQHVAPRAVTDSDLNPSNATVSAYDNDLVIKASAGTLFGLTGYNSGAEQFIQLHNASSAPSDTAVPVVIILVPASSPFAIDFGMYGRRFSTGIYVCNSSTGPAKTIGSSDCWFDAQYK